MSATVPPSRVPLSAADLHQHLIEQLDFLRADCRSFDAGNHAFGKRMAGILRILLHSKGRQKALLDQLGILDTIEFFDSGALRTDVSPACPQRMMILKAGEPPTHEPLMIIDPFPGWARFRAFSDWWEDAAIEDGHKATFSRKELVLNVAETDGGVHVDPALTPEYHAFTREQSMLKNRWSQWVVENTEGAPALVLMRQIAHEVLNTLRKGMPDLGRHAEPVLRERQYMIVSTTGGD